MPQNLNWSSSDRQPIRQPTRAEHKVDKGLRCSPAPLLDQKRKSRGPTVDRFTHTTHSLCHSGLSLRLDNRQVCPCLIATQPVSPSCASPGATLDQQPSEVPALSASYCALQRRRAQLHHLGQTGLPLSGFTAPRFQSESVTDGALHRAPD